MAVIGTFGSFTAARLGIYASQAYLNVTGNNIANINTEGYTRQRADLVSLYSYGNIRYANSYNLNIGYGVLIDGVSQLRDPYLDIRFRNENASMGAYEEKLDCLQQLAQVLDEVGRGTDEFGIVEAQFNDFLKQLQNLNGKVGSVEYDTTVRGSAQTLTRLLNDYSKAMDTLAANKLKELKEDVKTVNTLLTEIRDLNVQIRNAGIVGDKALELRDARNVCIDKLSAYMKIDVSYDLEMIDEFNSVERINISIADSGNPPIKLIQGIYGAQISMPDYAAARNPAFDLDDPACNRYISRDSDLANGIIRYTNTFREALTVGGEALKNDAEALKDALIAAGYGLDPDIEDPDEAKAAQEAAVDKFLADRVTEGYSYYDTTGKKDPYLILDEETGEIIGYTQDASEATQLPNAVEGDESNRLWMTVEPLVDVKGRYLRDEYHKEIRESVDLTDNQLHGSLQSLREFLTEKGEFCSDEDIQFDPDAAQKRGIQYYQKSLDALARKFADAFNRANQLDFKDVSAAYETGTNPKDLVPPVVFLDREGNRIEDSEGNAYGPAFFDELASKMTELEQLKEKAASKEFKTLDADEKKEILDKIDELEAYIDENTPKAYEFMEILRNEGQLTDLWSFYNGGVLFSNNGDTNDPTNITAGNITISAGWTTGEVRILNTKVADGLDHSTADDNIYHMIELMNEDMDYFPKEIVNNAMAEGGKRYFTGSFQERLADMNSIMAVDTETTTLLYNSYTFTTLSLENSRQSVSGVDLNDEATSMMVFQKSYAAACQLMTTLDSMLDKLINGTLR